MKKGPEIIHDEDELGFDAIDKEVKEFIERVYGSYTAFQNAVWSDVRTARELLKSDDNQFARRTFLRSFFSAVDGILFALRTIVFEFSKNETDSPVPNTFTDGERMLLQERSYELEDNGTVKVRNQNFQPFLKVLRFTFNVYSKLRRNEYLPDYSGAGWLSFRKATEIRHRITHPKSPEDLEISSEELLEIESAVKWFTESLNFMFSRI